MLPLWQYYLQDEGGDSYTVSNGTVTTTPTPTPLSRTPDGWQDIMIGYERNLSKVGLVRSFTFPLGFVREGATILRHLLYSGSIEQKVFLVIQKLALDTTASTFQYTYEPFYRGEIDLATLKDEELKVTVSIAETGIPKALKANEGTTYEVPLDHPDGIIVKMDGVYLKEKHNWLITKYARSTSQLIGTGFLSKEGQAAGFASFSTYSDFPPTDYTTAQDYFFITTQAITGLRFTGSFKFEIKGAAGPSYIALRTSKGRTIKLYDWPGIMNAGVYNLAIDETFDGEEDERFFLVFLISDSLTQVFWEESTISVDYQSRYRTTYAKALRPLTLLKELTGKITGDTTACYSDLLEEQRNIVITSIDAVRSIAGAKIKTSLNTFTDFCKVVHAAGMGVENNKIRIEAFRHFLNTDNVNALGQGKDLKTSVATDLLANTIKVGYPDPKIDDVNGKYAFNASLLFTSPVTRVTKELTLVSPYAADPYFIEIKRINFDGKTTTDDSSDNDVVLLNVEPIAFTSEGEAGDLWILGKVFYFPTLDHYEDFTSGAKFTVTGTGSNNKAFTVTGVSLYDTGFMVGVEESVVNEVFTAATFTLNVHRLVRKPYTEIEGLPEGVESSLFNIEYLTPKRILTRHMTWINSIMWGLQGEYLTYQTTEKNAGLKTTYGADIVDEDADVEIGEDRLFLPFYHDLDTRVPVNLPALEEADPSAAFSTLWNEGTLPGFLAKAGIAPDTNKEQSWKLLAAPDSDLTQLIQ